MWVHVFGSYIRCCTVSWIISSPGFSSTLRSTIIHTTEPLCSPIDTVTEGEPGLCWQAGGTKLGQMVKDKLQISLVY